MPLTSDVIHGFSGSLLARKYDGATPTPRFHLELWDLFTSPNKYVAAAAPRGHGKSTAITYAYVLSNVLFRERRFVILVSDTESQAVNFLNDIKLELKDNEDLLNLFAIKGFIKDTESDIIVEMEDGYTFRIIAKGSEQRVRGLKWNNLRPDLIVCDDLESDEQVYNKDRRDKFKRWFYGALLPILSVEGIVRVVGTILHLDSLLNNLMPEEHLKSTVIEPLRTYNFVTRSQWKSVRYRAHNEDYSEILWPSRFSKEIFIEKKSDYDVKGIGDVYAQEFLNYPIDESTSYFKRNELLEIPDRVLSELEEGEGEGFSFYVGVDFAISTKERSDYTVLAVVAMDTKGVLNVVDIRRGRWDTLEIVEELFAVQKKYEPEYFFIERGAIEKAIGAVLNYEMMVRRTYLNIISNTPTKDKQTRARSIQKLVRAGAIRFDKSAVWYPDLEDEMARFPKSRHDDQVDALSWVGLSIDHMDVQKTEEELEEEEWSLVRKDFSEMSRNRITGY